MCSGVQWCWLVIAAQNVAYVDERDEAFTFAPERVVALARGAADARALSDTLIAGVRYARVVAPVGKFRPTLHCRRSDGRLALVSFRAAQPNDFGLAPWGTMDVSITYWRWRKIPSSSLVLPMQLDVARVGRPYLQMDDIIARVRQRGWRVDRIGLARNFLGTPVTSASAASR